MSWPAVALGVPLVAVAAVPSLRRFVFNRVLFPIGYSLYTGGAGLLLHQRRYMSSATKKYTPHSIVSADSLPTYGSGNKALRVVPIPLFDDNYSYLILHDASMTAALVDPADPLPVINILKQTYSEYKLTHILTTHKHWSAARRTQVE